MSRNFLAPLSGVLFVVLLIIGWVVSGEPPEVSESTAQEIVDHYVDNDGAVYAGVAIGMVAITLLVLFANHLRRLFNAAGEAPLSAVILAGAVLAAAGAAFDGTLAIAQAEAAEDVPAEAIQTMQALWENDWVPMATGALLFLLACGVSTLQTRALPAWLGWAAIALVVIGPTPIGFVSFIGAGVWIIIASVLLTMRARTAGSPPTAAGV